ncbi:MAG: PDDEXK nuclease domain-containing protein [Pirellulaceae bacterium]
MTRKKTSTTDPLVAASDLPNYPALLGELTQLLESSRRAAARAVNAAMTATYWEIGRRIVEVEQAGADRAEYGQGLVKRLAEDLSSQFGRGFSERNLRSMRRFYQRGPIWQTVSAKLDSPYLGASEAAEQPKPTFILPWSHYLTLLSVESDQACGFYEKEAIRGGWSIRQLKRQINSQFYERTLLSRNKGAMLRGGQTAQPTDMVLPEEEIKDPLVLEFLDLKDEYSENDLEEALVHKLENFLMELGGDFAFVARQQKLRIDDEWFRVDLLFFHRRLRCLVVVDLKLGAFTHADAGQMHMYLNYAKEHWQLPHENPPVGLILCASKRKTLAKYALDGLPNKVLAAEYRTKLPDEQLLVHELEEARRLLDMRNEGKSNTANEA